MSSSNLTKYKFYIQPGYHNGTNTTSNSYTIVVEARNPGQAHDIAYGMNGGRDSGVEITYRGEVY